MAVVVGLDPAHLDQVVPTVMRDPRTLPVFLTDFDGFDVFRSHRAVFEYLPPARADDDLDWPLYRLRRLALLRRKWQPLRIIAFGAAAADLVAQWRDSPFEDPARDADFGGVGRTTQ